MKTKNNSSGYTIVILLVSILIVALLSIYAVNKIYFKRSEQLKEELPNGPIQNPPTLENAQNQVDEVQGQMKDLQNQQQERMDKLMENK